MYERLPYAAVKCHDDARLGGTETVQFHQEFLDVAFVLDVSVQKKVIRGRPPHLLEGRYPVAANGVGRVFADKQKADGIEEFDGPVRCGVDLNDGIIRPDINGKIPE